MIELKHAKAVSLADEINVLLSEAGANVTLQRPATGLSGGNLSDVDEGTGAVGRDVQEGEDIRFPWQVGGRQREDQSPETSLIGKIRVVPIIRQNALAVVAPPAYQEIVREFIQYLDRPGRQVMISAVLAEVELNDDLALGIRVSSADALSPTLIDNALAANLGGTGEFSIGNMTFMTRTNINIILQALDQKTNVRILQEPVVFTADNQEAVFFDGQDFPFTTDATTNVAGNLVASFDYRQVGVVLNVRPRITAQGDVDVEIYLELSSIVEGQTGPGGGFIVDRRLHHLQRGGAELADHRPRRHPAGLRDGDPPQGAAARRHPHRRCPVQLHRAERHHHRADRVHHAHGGRASERERHQLQRAGPPAAASVLHQGHGGLREVRA